MPCPVTTDPAAAAAALCRGGLVALPTETVYGLGADAGDPKAVARIFAAKNRPFFDPLIVHLADRDWLPRVVAELPPLAERLASRFWPGPLTLVLPKTAAVPDLVTAGLPTVAVRIPRHALMQEVLRLADRPIAAPSANPFGRLSPTTAAHVQEQLGDRIDLILDGGPCTVGVESTILQVAGDQVLLLRPGGLAVEDVEAVVGPVGRPSPAVADSPAAPGMLPQHYAPRTPIRLVDDVPPCHPAEGRVGLLCLRPATTSGYAAVEALSPTGDLTEAAAGFFEALHRLDASGLNAIVATRFPDVGLGRALNDRLRRAAASHP